MESRERNEIKSKFLSTFYDFQKVVWNSLYKVLWYSKKIFLKFSLVGEFSKNFERQETVFWWISVKKNKIISTFLTSFCNHQQLVLNYSWWLFMKFLISSLEKTGMPKLSRPEMRKSYKKIFVNNNTIRKLKNYWSEVYRETLESYRNSLLSYMDLKNFWKNLCKITEFWIIQKFK